MTGVSPGAPAAGRSVIQVSILFSRRVAPLVPYAGTFVVTWALLATASRLSFGDIAVAFVLQVVVGVMLFWAHRLDRRPWIGVVGVIMFIASVALLRDGVGATAGYSSLLLLPVIWAAVRRRSAELCCALGGAALVLFVPIVTVGGAQFPSSGWRSGALWLVIAAGLGLAVLTLIDQQRSSNDRQRLLAENSSDLVARFARDGTIIYASPASRALLGYEPEELIGLTIVDFMHDDDRAVHGQSRLLVHSSPDMIQHEFRLHHKDGRWLWFESTVRAIRDSSGAVTERQAAIRLVEERKHLQLTVERQRDEATNLLAEQKALREIATLVASGARPSAVFGAVAEQLANLFDGTLGGVIRFDASAGVGEVVGGWTADGSGITGQTIDLAGISGSARVYQTGAAVQVAGYADGSSERNRDEFALGGAVCAPITAEGRLWGSVNAAFAADTKIPTGVQDRLASFAALVALAISSAEALETLSRQATTDPITGLANYRAFHERLSSEVERSSRHGRPLSVAVMDLDHFKQVNDTYGHQAGDRVLAEVARRLATAVRGGELMARIGGEEFAWLMPEATPDDAHAAAERVRRAIHHTPFDGAGALTISIGLCSNGQAQTAAEFVGFADQALYWSKHSGRNVTSTFTEDARRTRSVVERALAPSARRVGRV
jgi:diguanylate cyclase (GGDEF)-like protein/PAS domain S-box-containing protein